MVQGAPVYFLKEFDALSQKFLLSGNFHSTKWSFLSWATICRHKKEGGLGLRSTLLNSQALATKLCWRWCSGQHQLWARIITHKYFDGVDPCSVSTLPLEGHVSMVWHTLKIGAVLVKRGLFWICKGGSEALFWSDAWDGFPSILSMYPIFSLFVTLFMSLDGIKWLITRLLINWDLLLVIDGSIPLIGLQEAKTWIVRRFLRF